METAPRRSLDDPSIPLNLVTFVVVDVETTGGSPATCSLTEVAAARYCGGELLGTYRTFVRPDERIPPFITALTGISDAMVADAPRVGEMLPSFVEFVGGAVLVGHNLRFDLSFLDHALISTGRSPLSNATVDTLALSRRLVRDVVPNCQLATLASVLRLANQPSHRALDDVLATGDLLHAMIERAGSFGILCLDELLDLPRLIGHPHAGKLRLTTRLPQGCGVYWLTDAAGDVLTVGRADDLRARVRSYFAGEKSRSVNRLLRQLHAIGYLRCAGPLSAAVIEGRLTRSLSPPFDDRGIRTRARAEAQAAGSSAPPARRPDRRRSRRPEWSVEELAGDPLAILFPLADQLAELRRRQRFEEAASVRDRAERLRHRLIEHRRVAAFHRAGRVVLLVEGEGRVELEDGLLVGGHGTAPSAHLASDRAIDHALTGDGGPGEQILVAEWLDAHADRVRVLGVSADQGLSMPATRIPRLSELCRAAPTPGPMDESAIASVVQYA